MAENDTGASGQGAASNGGGIGPSPIPTPSGTKNIESPFTPPDSVGKNALSSEKDLQGDIAKILEEVKLPERRGEAPPRSDKPPVFPTNPASPTPSAPKPTPPAEKNIVTPLRTLKDDLQTVVRDQKISVIHAAALEEDKRAKQASVLTTSDVHKAQKRRIIGSVAMIAGLFVLGLLALGAVFMIMNERAASTGEHVYNQYSLLFSEQTIPFPLQNHSSSELKRLLADARLSASLTLGAITRIAPTVEEVDQETNTTRERLATTEEFFDSIRAQAPAELMRAVSDEFFFGFHTVDENAPVIVIPVTSYERAFAGMLLWEDAMNTELSPIFTPVSPLIQEDGLLKKRAFKDIVMRNYDVRALMDDKGEVQLYYSFPTREILIIAESSYSFTEILSRLRADRRL